MRLQFLFLLVLGWLHLCSAWDNFDHEIFDLVTELEADGLTSFYGWLDVPSSASTSEIAKAYRKLSVKLHPDKNPGVKGVHERYSRLTKVSTILRNKEKRERYDFFYKNGVPKWRGTGYYYSRFRPGLGSVLTFLIFLTSGLQYLVQKMNYNKDVQRIDHFITEARLAAWGPKMTPLNGQRKVKFNLGGRSRLDEDGNVIQGRWIDMVVNETEVYILDPNGDMDLLDRNAATSPSWLNTWFIVLAKSLVKKATGKKDDSEESVQVHEELDLDDNASDVTSDSPGSGAVTPTGSTSSASKGKTTKKRKNTKKR
ncbi:DnaJ domain-containing protein [Flagelloscypha sp. PMI_526]|nr:DnaJ domain-containing protein [Flagelloscypha sp. PMI_526]